MKTINVTLAYSQARTDHEALLSLHEKARKLRALADDKTEEEGLSATGAMQVEHVQKLAHQLCESLALFTGEAEERRNEAAVAALSEPAEDEQSYDGEWEEDTSRHDTTPAPAPFAHEECWP